MSNEPFISIIIPNYNHAPFLETRISSVLNQSYKNFEVIILDDFSTDSSRDIIEKYKSHPQISHIIYNQENSGSTFKQWNKGIALTSGEWIWIAESDDSANEDFLRKMINHIANKDNIGIAYCQSMSIDANNKVWGDCLMWTDDLDTNLWRRDFTLNGRDAIQKYLIVKNIIPNASACLISKKALNDSNNAPINMKHSGDWFLWCNILLKYNLAYVHEALNLYRFHSSTTRTFHDISKFKNKVEEDCKVINLIIANTIVDENKIQNSLKKLENDVYTYYKESRQLPISLKKFKMIFTKYNLPVTISAFKLYKTYLSLLWKKLK